MAFEIVKPSILTAQFFIGIESIQAAQDGIKKALQRVDSLEWCVEWLEGNL